MLISIHSTGRSRDVEAVVAPKYLHAAPCHVYGIKIVTTVIVLTGLSALRPKLNTINCLR